MNKQLRASQAIASAYTPAKGKALIDLTGQRFGRWLVVGLFAHAGKGTRWQCMCDCGNQKSVAAPSLRRGLSTSCGCLSRTHGGYGTRVYRIWANMLNRCRNPTLKCYKDYGGRGISVCAEWHLFPAFLAWAESSGYADFLTIERINHGGNYEPNNCTWIPRSRQAVNRRTVKMRPDGTAWIDYARAHGISGKQFSGRLRIGWEPERAATTPVGPNPRLAVAG